MNGNCDKRVVIAGGSGFIGRTLTEALRARNYEVVVLTRQRRPRRDGVKEIEWSLEHIGEWIKHLDGAAAVVNLVGRNINCRHTPENLRAILDSRVKSINSIAAALEHTPRAPRAWVQAGAIGIYGDRQDEWCDETSTAGSDPLAEICTTWERTFSSAAAPRTRRVLLRIGMALGRNGGALPVLAKLTKRFLGGSAGSGRQFISWIHIADLTAAFVASIEQEDWLGTFNAVAPSPVTNGEFMGELRRTLRRPWCPPTPEFAVKIGARLMNSEPSLALTSCRCAPMRLLESGFTFQFPDLPSALKELYASNCGAI